MKKKNFIIVTGCNGLLGTSLTSKLLEDGYFVLGVDLNKNNFKHKNFLYFKCDLTVENKIKNLFNFIVKKKINIVSLINNAAIDNKVKSNSSFNFVNYKYKNWKKVMTANIDSVFLITKYICKIFEKNNFGTIVNVSSTYGLVAPDNSIYKNSLNFKKSIDYPTTKSAIIGFTRSLASYYSKKNIRVNCICPGGIEANQSKKFIKEYSKKTIIGRMAKVDEISNGIMFLISQKSSYVTGSTLVVDGGWTTI
jgi:NAD(P)-dependent dehydrogenase (short-subunit alcohol dehydrogenase family)